MPDPLDKNTANWLLNLMFAIGFAAIGAVGKMVVDDVTQLANKVDKLPTTYVLKTDYIHDQDRLFDALQSIASKIDKNAEVLETDYNRRMDKLEKILVELSRQ